MVRQPQTESIWKLRVDLVSARVLIWAASVGRDAELTPETHFYLANRYDRLSHVYRVRGRHALASRLALRAAEHYRAGGWTGPPYAAAMALPRPRSWVVVNALSHRRAGEPGNVA